ncbi:S8 family serine peptidase [Aromatoleum aromaticum]|uniref:S8 family serine peptidase n=1 Tax=Aromatoleum aromaticum TaxID=551760 RepID=UPI0014599A8C|nr:S8 family serine peptidase [Aromatoleum aromaticum]
MTAFGFVKRVWGASLVATLVASAPAFGQCTPRVFSAAEDDALRAYVAYYGRPADTGGLAYWADRLQREGGLASIIGAFGVSAEFSARFGLLAPDALVNNLFQQTFNRPADPQGLAYYTDELQRGRRTLPRIALDVLYGARNSDATVIANKLQVARHVTTRLETSGRNYADGLAGILLQVGSETLSVGAGCSQVDTLLGVSGGAGDRLAGMVSPLAGNQADGDTRDLAADFAPNDSIEQAQRIASTTTVGGFVADTVDPADIYIADLVAGQSIVLNFPASDYDDIDLYLYDSSGSLIDAALGTTEFETLAVPQDGTYYVEVYAFSGEANYMMNIGLGAAPVGLGALRLSDPVVPGQVLVRLKPEIVAQGVPAARSRARSVQADLGAAHLAGEATREMRWGLNALRTPPVRGAAGKSAGLPASVNKALATLEQIKALRRHPDVALAEPVFLVKPSATPNDSLYLRQWHYPMINLPAAWDLTTGSSDVIVAVIDTGILLNHPDLAGQIVPGYDFISDASMAGDGNGIDPNADDPGDGGAVERHSWHGTHVAGTIGARTNNDSGVAGIAWTTRLMPIRVLGVGGGTNYDVMQGIRYAAGLPNDSGTVPVQPARIINMSLGGGGGSQAGQDVIEQARARGTIIIAAAGNESTSLPSYPASYAGVVSVSAVGSDRRLAPYSNFGSTVDVAAPGGNASVDHDGDGVSDGVLSTLGGRTGNEFRYDYYQGTSMAAPHVAGVAALMASVFPGLTPDEFDALLANGRITDGIGVYGRDDLYGHGLINALKAVLAAQELAGQAGGAVALPYLSPASLNLGLSEDASTVVVSNGGTGRLQVQEVKTGSSWLSAMAEDVDMDGLGRYRIRADRSVLGNGVHQGEVQFVTNAGTVGLMVTVQVLDLDLTDDAGFQYVLLIDADTLETLEARSGSTRNGLSFDFSGLAPGRYYIVAGTDMNNDGYICDFGEACGGYPDISSLIPLSLPEQGSTETNFASGFRAEFRTSSGQAMSAFAARLRDGGGGYAIAAVPFRRSREEW